MPRLCQYEDKNTMNTEEIEGKNVMDVSANNTSNLTSSYEYESLYCIESSHSSIILEELEENATAWNYYTQDKARLCSTSVEIIVECDLDDIVEDSVNAKWVTKTPNHQ